MGSQFEFPRESQTDSTMHVCFGYVLLPARYPWAPGAFLPWDLVHPLRRGPRRQARGGK